MEDLEFLKDFDNQLDALDNEELEPENEEEEEIINEEPESEEEVLEVELEPENNGEEEEKVEPEEVTTEEEIDYKSFYEELMQPFKANGRTIELKSGEEVKSLMKMGANYTKKMQEISQYRKTIATLNDNGIKTEEDILFLIDLKKNNPEALKKLLKDNNVDPFDIDTEEEVNYKPTAKFTSDKLIDAREVLEEVNSTPEGRDTLNEISEKFDEQSTQFLWDNPEVFRYLHEQKMSGVYDTIMNEVERQTSLGMLDANEPIIARYNAVGSKLSNLDNSQPKDNTRIPIDTRKASSTKQNKVSNKAKAASIPRGGNKQSIILDDLLEMNDEDFLKAMNSIKV